MQRISFMLMMVAVLAACAPEAKVPVETMFYQNGAGVQADCLVVFIPGRGDRKNDFERKGFVAAAKRSGVRADFMATNLHIGYYINKSVMHRLQKDVLEPARLKGYDKIWLVGISMGAMGAIYHERVYPDEVEGMVLIAPFLGDDDVLDEVEQAGGVLAWKQTAVDGEDYEQDLWAWVQKYALGSASPQLYLAYGTRDRFARSSRLLASVLPEDHVITLDGRHLWGTWLRLWDEVLDREILCNSN